MQRLNQGYVTDLYDVYEDNTGMDGYMLPW